MEPTQSHRTRAYDQTDTTRAASSTTRTDATVSARAWSHSSVTHTHCMRPPGRSLSSRRPALSLSQPSGANAHLHTLSQPYHVHCMALDTAHAEHSYKLRWPSLAHALERPYPSLAYPQLSNGTRPAPAISPLIYSPSPSVSGTEPSGSPRGSGISPSSRSSVSSVCSMLVPAGGGPCTRE